MDPDCCWMCSSPGFFIWLHYSMLIEVNCARTTVLRKLLNVLEPQNSTKWMPWVIAWTSNQLSVCGVKDTWGFKGRTSDWTSPAAETLNWNLRDVIEKLNWKNQLLPPRFISTTSLSPSGSFFCSVRFTHNIRNLTVNRSACDLLGASDCYDTLKQ